MRNLFPIHCAYHAFDLYAPLSQLSNNSWIKSPSRTYSCQLLGLVKPHSLEFSNRIVL
ncbi:hypothetical protein CPB83DRAFT_841938 [Crepidotus variabilis]|uniref:Uncharacterized protein n=1 Tax=Crepidotus variabilis TaxID=179855 RepID=A0A9P6EUJ9_9AGAR|nr:hypothetical protein CPB83DRAFT_841938 [Crepidotus variabilis]